MDAIKKTILIIFMLGVSPLINGQDESADSTFIRAIYDEVLGNGECHENLHYLCKEIGARLSGSEELGEAILWGESLFP